MSVKFFIYFFVSILVVWAMGGLNLNGMFKQGRIIQARVIYGLIALALIYLITNFIYDFYLSSKFF